MIPTLHIIPSQLFRVLGGGSNQWSGLWGLIQDQDLVPSLCKSHLLMIHQNPNALVSVFGNENQYSCQWILFSCQAWWTWVFPILLRVTLPLAFPTPTQLFFFVSCQIQRERNCFLNFAFYYVNICEQINCECGFHLFPCLGPTFHFQPIEAQCTWQRWVGAQWGGFKFINDSKARNKTRTPALSLREETVFRRLSP